MCTAFVAIAEYIEIYIFDGNQLRSPTSVQQKVVKQNSPLLHMSQLQVHRDRVFIVRTTKEYNLE